MANDGSESHEEWFSRKDGVGWLLRRMWVCGTGESRGERKPSIPPGGVRTFANPTCGTSARLVDLYSSYVCEFALFCIYVIVSIRILSAIYHRWVQYGTCSCFYCWATSASRCFALCIFTS